MTQNPELGTMVQPIQPTDPADGFAKFAVRLYRNDKNIFTVVVGNAINDIALFSGEEKKARAFYEILKNRIEAAYKIYDEEIMAAIRASFASTTTYSNMDTSTFRSNVSATPVGGIQGTNQGFNGYDTTFGMTPEHMSMKSNFPPFESDQS